MAGRINRDSKKKEADFIILLTSVTLVVVGIVMVFSSTFWTAEASRGDAFFHLRRQVIWAFLGMCGMFFFSNYDYRKLKRWVNLALLASFILLLAVFIPGVGMEINGVRRWIGLGGITGQPSDLARLSLLLFSAAYLSRKDIRINKFFEGPFPVLLALGTFFFLIMLQPDFGTAMAMAGTIMIIIFVAGIPLYQLGITAATAVPMAAYLVFSEPYRLRRILSYRDPWADPLNTGYQIIQSLYALGSGGLFGLGLAVGRQKLFHLPESHSDFIFAVIGEEFGFIGTSSVLLLYLLLLWRGFKVALTAPDSFGSLLATGITAMIGLQALINIGVVTGVLPVTGINLPLISTGGSSLLFALSSIGILLNISKFSK